MPGESCAEVQTVFGQLTRSAKTRNTLTRPAEKGGRPRGKPGVGVASPAGYRGGVQTPLSGTGRDASCGVRTIETAVGHYERACLDCADTPRGDVDHLSRSRAPRADDPNLARL